MALPVGIGQMETTNNDNATATANTNNNNNNNNNNGGVKQMRFLVKRNTEKASTRGNLLARAIAVPSNTALAHTAEEHRKADRDERRELGQIVMERLAREAAEADAEQERVLEAQLGNSAMSVSGHASGTTQRARRRAYQRAQAKLDKEDLARRRYFDPNI